MVTLLFDSGASVSVVHHKLLQYLDHTSYTSKRAKTYVTASGEQFGTGRVATFTVQPMGIDKALDIVEALVIDDIHALVDQVIVGTPELNREGIVLDFDANEISSKFWNEPLNMKTVKRNKVMVAYEKIDTDSDSDLDSYHSSCHCTGINDTTDKQVTNVRSKVEKDKGTRQAQKVLKALVGAPRPKPAVSMVNNHGSGPEAETGPVQKANSTREAAAPAKGKATAPERKVAPQLDARANYKQRMDRMLEERRQKYTTDDVTFDSEFEQENPKLVKKCKDLIQKYKPVFQDTTGCAPARYTARAKIEGKGSLARRELSTYSDKERDAICAQLDEEFCDGVLVFPDEHDVVPRNILQVMVVDKKDDDGKVVAWTTAARVVVACNQRVNKITKVPAFETDNLQDVARKAAIASVHGYKCRFDIKKAFLNIPIDKEMWGDFCVVHPIHGIMCYTRCCMGWVGSMGLVKNAFLQIYADLSNNIFRFMDDGFLYAKTEEEFLSVFEHFLAVTQHNNLRIKGSKLKMFQSKMNFLGSMIVNGVIFPSPHQQAKALKFTTERVKRVTDLRSYLGLCQFLAKFMHRSTEVFSALRKWIGKKSGQMEIPWDDNNGSLRNEFDKT